MVRGPNGWRCPRNGIYCRLQVLGSDLLPWGGAVWLRLAARFLGRTRLSRLSVNVIRQRHPSTSSGKSRERIAVRLVNTGCCIGLPATQCPYVSVTILGVGAALVWGAKKPFAFSGTGPFGVRCQQPGGSTRCAGWISRDAARCG